MDTPIPAAEVWEVIWLTLKVSVWCVLLDLPVALACGWLLARKQFPGKLLLDGLLHLPLVLPPVTVGYLLLLLLGTRGWLGQYLAAWFGWHLVFTWPAAAIAAAVVSFPLMLRTIRVAFELSDPGLEAAARTLGAGPWRTLATITLPLALPGIIAGALLAFARSLGEFGATITFAGNIAGSTRTLPLAIYTYMQSPAGDDAVRELALISVVIALLALGGAEWWTRRARQLSRTRPGGAP